MRSAIPNLIRWARLCFARWMLSLRRRFEAR